MQEKIDLNEIDYQDGLKRFVMNEKLYNEFLLKFTDEKRVEDIKQAYEEKNLEQLRNAVHTLKGLSANLSIKNIHLICTEMIHAIIDNNKEEIKIKYDLLMNKYKVVSKMIKEAIK